jgi:hypothetical protein
MVFAGWGPKEGIPMKTLRRGHEWPVLLLRLVVLVVVLGGSASAVVLCAKPKKDGTFSTLRNEFRLGQRTVQ